MFEPDLYRKANTVPRQDAFLYLERYACDLKWKSGDSIIDLGCGEGSVTMEVLRKFLPTDYKKLVGCDIGKEMINHATKEYGDERNTFVVWDVTSVVPSEFVSSFNHAFSFYALHWVQDQQRMFTNIHDILSDDGDCLLVYLNRTVVFDFYRVLAKHDSWKRYLLDAEEYISPYHDIQDPETLVQERMELAGFKNVTVRREQKQYVYDEVLFRMTMEAICPFKIPAELRSQFMEDYMQVVRDMDLIRTVGDQTIIPVDYSLVIVTATKKSRVPDVEINISPI